MFITLLSMLGGGVMRMLPELLGFLNKKADNAHELAMLEKQFQLEQSRSRNRINEIEAHGNFDQAIALLDAQKAALTSQMQKTGIRWVDALNFSVRPITTYYFLAFYGLVKLSMLIIAFQFSSPWEAIIRVWSADDATILSGILAFWFVGRVFEKRRC